MSKVILITGISNSFGKVLVSELSHAGHIIIAGIRGLHNENSDVAKKLSTLPNVEVVSLDDTNEISIECVVAYINTKYGTIDVLVNNSGLVGYGLFEADSLENMKQLFESNLLNVLRICNAVVSSMKTNTSGLIINISSRSGMFTHLVNLKPGTTEFNLQTTVENLLLDFRQHGISYVTMQPGSYKDTQEFRSVNDRDLILKLYGKEAQLAFDKFGTVICEKLCEFKNDSSQVAQGILTLIEMDKNLLPYQYPRIFKN